jgi:short subunit fatty acids transporter
VAGVFVVGRRGAAAAMVLVFSAISTSISWSDGIMMGTLLAGAELGITTDGREVSALVVAIIGTGLAPGVGLGLAARAAACAASSTLNRSLRSGSWTL